MEQNINPLLGKHSGSHHGTPDLFERDIKLLMDYQLWVKTVRDTGLERYANFSPGHIDMLKSRLFWRIRSGKAPLPDPPPTAFSCPWYELIEVPGPHDVWEEVRVYRADGVYRLYDQAYVAQSMYRLEEEYEDHFILRYNRYKFKAWNGMIPTRSWVTDAVTGEKKVIDTEKPGGWIEYIGDA